MTSNIQTRIGELYLQVVPVLTGVKEAVTDQITAAIDDASNSTDLQSSSSAMGTNMGETAGETSASALGKKLVAGIAALKLGEVLAAAVTEGLDQIDTNNLIKASLNLTDAQSEVLKAATQDLYVQNYGETYDAVANTMKQIVSSVDSAKTATADELTSMGKDVMNLQSVYGLSAEQITAAVQTMVGTGFASNWNDAVSIILSGYQTMGASGEDWIDTLNEYSDDFKKLGFSGNEAINYINEGIQSGVMNTDKLADALNEVSIRLADGTADDALTSLGFDPDTIKAQIAAGGDAAQQALISVFNKLQSDGTFTEWQSILGTMYEDFQVAFDNMDLSSLNQSLKEGTGNLQTFDQTINEGANASLESFKRLISESFVQVLTPVLEIVNPLLQTFVTWLQENETAADALATVVTLGLVGGLVLVSAALWSMVPAGFAAVASVAPFIGTVLAVTGAIALVVGSIVWLIDSWDMLKATASSAIYTVKGLFADLWQSIVSGAQSVWNFINNFGTSIMNVFSTIGNTIAGVFKTIANGAIAGVNTIISAINFLTSGINTIGFSVPDFLGGGNVSFDIPQIPKVSYLAEGGTIPARDGGTLAVLGEAGRDEVVMDAGKWNQLLDQLLSSGINDSSNISYVINIYQKDNQSTEELVAAIEEYLQLNQLKPSAYFDGSYR